MREQENGPQGDPAPEGQLPPTGEQPPAGGQAPPPQGVDEEELRRRIEEQLRKVRVHDLLLESVVSIANLTARRISKEDEQDLEQARLGIDAMRAVVHLIAPEPQKQIRNAISELQVLYAKHAQGGGEPPAEAAGARGGEGAEPAPEREPRRRPDSGLWTPPGTS